jgi:ribosomal protein L40E
VTKICPKCRAENLDTAVFCQNCGEDLNNVKSSVKPTEASNVGAGGWWSKQGTGTKLAVGIGGVCCIGLILIVIIGGMFAPDATTTNTTSENSTDQPNTTSQSTQSTATTETPKTVTISQLYNNQVPEGTYVKVTGTVLQSDGTTLRIEDADSQDIVIEGVNVNAYEGNNVTVVGTYTGPGSYETVMGSSRTVPYVKYAEVV